MSREGGSFSQASFSAIDNAAYNLARMRTSRTMSPAGRDDQGPHERVSAPLLPPLPQGGHHPLHGSSSRNKFTAPMPAQQALRMHDTRSRSLERLPRGVLPQRRHQAAKASAPLFAKVRGDGG